jgi:hypothetical protein
MPQEPGGTQVSQQHGSKKDGKYVRSEKGLLWKAISLKLSHKFIGKLMQLRLIIVVYEARAD